ncbi:hypothetical protein D3C85_947320 [compost metagenome]
MKGETASYAIALWIRWQPNDRRGSLLETIFVHNRSHCRCVARDDDVRVRQYRMVRHTYCLFHLFEPSLQA